MSYRFVQPRSDRGSIKDIQKAVTNFLQEDPNLPPTPQELRVKALYEHAVVLQDRPLIDSLGLIVMDGSAKDPVAIMRHREYIKGLAAKFGIAELQRELEQPAGYKQKRALDTILLEDGTMVKHARTGFEYPVHKLRSFWRVK